MTPIIRTNTVVGLMALTLSAHAALAEPFCSELLEKDQLASKYQRLAPIYSDTDTGWVFTSDQLDVEYAMKSEAEWLMSQIVDAFHTQDVEFGIMIPPPRPVVAGQITVDATLGQIGQFDVEAVGASFETLIGQLLQTGAIVPDLLSVATTAEVGDDFYFERDTHWTPSGAAVSALAFAASMGIDTPAFALSDVQSNDLYAEKGSLNAIVAATCEVENSAEETPTLDFSAVASNQGMSLLGDAREGSIALLGTSFSDRNKRDQYQVADALAAATDMDVYNYSVSGGGMIGPMEAFVLSGDFAAAEHDLVVWEFPYTQSLNSTSQLRQLLGALRSREAGDGIETSLNLRGNTATLDWSESPITTNLVQVLTENPDLMKLRIELEFENGKTKTIKLGRKDRIPQDRRSTEWWVDLSGWSHGRIAHITLKFEEDVETGAVSLRHFDETEAS